MCVVGGDKKQHVEENTVSNFTKRQQMMVFSFPL